MGVERKEKRISVFAWQAKFVQHWLKKWHAFYLVSRLPCFSSSRDRPMVKREMPLSSVNTGYFYDKASSMAYVFLQQKWYWRRVFLTRIWGGIYPGRVEPASPRAKHGDVSWVVNTPRSSVPTSLHLLALQLKLTMPGLRAPARPLFTLSFLVLIRMIRRGRKEYWSLIGRDVLITQFFGRFCRSVGA